MEDLLDEIEIDSEEELTDDVEKKVRVVKPSIPIQLTETIRIVLASDRKNLQIQSRTDEADSEDTSGDDTDEGWKTKCYYGTKNWRGAIECASALAREEKLSKDTKVSLEDLNYAIRDNTKEIKTWAKEITDTLINNKIIL